VVLRRNDVIPDPIAR